MVAAGRQSVVALLSTAASASLYTIYSHVFFADYKSYDGVAKESLAHEAPGPSTEDVFDKQMRQLYKYREPVIRKKWDHWLADDECGPRPNFEQFFAQSE